MRNPTTTAFGVAVEPPGWTTYCTSGCRLHHFVTAILYVSSKTSRGPRAARSGCDRAKSRLMRA
jgi:hypothetical protein